MLDGDLRRRAAVDSHRHHCTLRIEEEQFSAIPAPPWLYAAGLRHLRYIVKRGKRRNKDLPLPVAKLTIGDQVSIRRQMELILRENRCVYSLRFPITLQR